MVLHWSNLVIQCKGSLLKNVGKGGFRIHRTLVRSTIFKTGDKSLYYYLKLYLNVFI